MLSTRHFQHRYVPAEKPGDRERVLVVLHGLGDSLEGFAFLPRELGVGEFSHLLLNAPDPYHGGFSWFDFLGDPEPGVLRSRELLLKMLDELEEQGLQAKDIFLFGFSQGCLMALDAGLRAGVELGGICGVSGWLAFQEEYPAAFSPMARKQDFLVTHGTRDPMVPFKVTQDQCKFLAAQGIDIAFRAYEKEHTMLPEEVGDIREWLLQRMERAGA